MTDIPPVYSTVKAFDVWLYWERSSYYSRLFASAVQSNTEPFMLLKAILLKL